MFLSFLFLCLFFPAYIYTDSTSIRPCTYVPLEPITSQSPLTCSSYLGSLFFNQTNYIICASNSSVSIDILTLEMNLTISLHLNSSNSLSNIKKCHQLFGDYSNILVCSCNSTLLLWDLNSGNFTGLYNESYWSQIPDFFPISESQSSLIVIQDEKIVKLIDIIKNSEINVFGTQANFTRAIVMQKGNFLGIHYNYEGKKVIDIWDIVNVIKKYSWEIDLDFALDVYLSQKHIVVGYKNNLLKTWDFLLNTVKSIKISSNIIKNIETIKEIDGQTKNLIIYVENDALLMYNLLTETLKNRIEEYPNPNNEIYSKSFNTYNGLLLIKSENYYFFNVTSSAIFKIIGLDLISEPLNFYWNSTNTLELLLFYNNNGQNYKINLNLAICEPIDLMKESSISFKSALQTPSQNESLILTVNEDNTVSLFSPYSRKIIKTFAIPSNLQVFSAIMISCPNKNLIVLNGKENLGYTLFLLELNTSEIKKGLHRNFSTTINNLLYLNIRNLIAFENSGIVYVFDIINQNLIRNFSHNLGNSFTYFINLQNIPYVLASTAKNTIYFWNIFEGKAITYTNFSQISIEIEVFQSMLLNEYKTKEILVGSYKLNSKNILEFYDLSTFRIAFQLEDSRPLQLKYFKTFHFMKNYVDYLLVFTNLTNDLWNLKTQKLEKSLYLPKAQTSFVQFQSSENVIFDISNKTLALWAYFQANSQDLSNFSICKQAYFFQNLTNTCEKCDSLCNSNCFSAQYDQCLPPSCNYLFEKSTAIASSECFDCSLDNYFIQNEQQCMYFNSFFTDNSLKTYCFGCNNGFYYSSSLCLPCSEDCKSCYGPLKEQCLVCEDDYILFKNHCYKKNENTSFFPLMIVYAVVLGFVVLIAVLYLCKMIYDYRLPCLIWKKTWKCLNCLFFDDKFINTRRKTAFTPTPQQDNSQINGFIQPNEVEIVFASNTARAGGTKRTPYLLNMEGFNQNFDHYTILINAMTKFKGLLMENKENHKSKALKLTASLVAELKEEIPFFMHELINLEDNFDKNYYFQIKIVKKIGNGAYGPVFLGEKLCKTKMAIKIFFDNVEEVNVKKINKFLFYLNEQDKIKYNSFSRVVPINSLVFSSNNSNFCLGVMEEFYDYNLDIFLSKYFKNIHFVQKIDMTLQILDCIKSLHDLHVVHRNIKANNILINNEDLNYSINIKINDFSKYLKLSTIFYSYKAANNNLFNLIYIPPECLDKQVFGRPKYSSDLWSIGILLYDIFYPDSSQCLDIPWAHLFDDLTEKYKKQSAVQKFNEVFKSEIPKENYYCKKDPLVHVEITEIINMCLKANPEKRIQIHELIWKAQLIKAKFLNK